MLSEKLQTLDRVLRDNHAVLYADLQPGVAGKTGMDRLSEWFAWKNGQNGGSAPYGGALLFGWHRFVPFAEGQSQFKAARRALWTNPIYAIFTLTIGRHLLRSWPILVDASGAGYYYDTGRRTVLYRVEGDPDVLFNTFESFVDYLIELSRSMADSKTFLETEGRMLEQYARKTV